MKTCETCGNEYARTFEVVMDGETHVFDSFECAIHALAPSCGNCGVRIVGHGVEAHSGALYCCARCARAEGVHGATDHVRREQTGKTPRPGGPPLPEEGL